MTEFRINRDNVRKAFAEYTSHYDNANEKIHLKVEHTYKVAEICQRIAATERQTEADINLAWLLGMLHDVGRFEQLRRFGTFIDSVSVDHAEYGADLLFKEDKIRDYISDTGEDHLIETAIRVHNKYRLPSELSERETLFSNILRDADKIDILRVNVETPMEEIYDVTTKDLKNAEVSPVVMKAFEEHHAVKRDLMRTAVDHLVGHIALAYELVFPISLQIASEQGFLEQMMNFQSENSKTQDNFRELKKEYMNWKKQ